MSDHSRRIVIGISGSSGPIYGVRTLEALRAAGSYGWSVDKTCQVCDRRRNSFTFFMQSNKSNSSVFANKVWSGSFRDSSSDQ
jgi:3-polyprenyl-4-hydroxybenzoate decarboxylase